MEAAGSVAKQAVVKVEEREVERVQSAWFLSTTFLQQLPPPPRLAPSQWEAVSGQMSPSREEECAVNC